MASAATSVSCEKRKRGEIADWHVAGPRCTRVSVQGGRGAIQLLGHFYLKAGNELR